MQVNDKVEILTGDHAGRIARITRVKGPKTVQLSVLGPDGNGSFSLWNVKKADLRAVDENA